MVPWNAAMCWRKKEKGAKPLPIRSYTKDAIKNAYGIFDEKSKKNNKAQNKKNFFLHLCHKNYLPFGDAEYLPSKSELYNFFAYCAKPGLDETGKILDKYQCGEVKKRRPTIMACCSKDCSAVPMLFKQVEQVLGSLFAACHGTLMAINTNPVRIR